MALRRSYPGTITALATIAHGSDENTGNIKTVRSERCWSPVTSSYVRMPFLSGNGIRGNLRDLIFQDLMRTIGYRHWGPKLHHALFSGGVLESVDDSGGKVDVGFRRTMRERIVPLALLGTSAGNQMLRGVLDVSKAYPVCLEMSWCQQRYREDPRSQRPVREFLTTDFLTRMDDLREDRSNGDATVQMLAEFEVFTEGCAFAHEFGLTLATELEESCLGRMLELWREVPYVGGKRSIGHGRVSLDYQDVPDSRRYMDHITDQANVICATLDELAERLGDRRGQTPSNNPS